MMRNSDLEIHKIAKNEIGNDDNNNKARHDSIAQIIHWDLCGMYGFEREKKWYEHEPQSVLENEEAKILWDFTIQCDHLIQS